MKKVLQLFVLTLVCSRVFAQDPHLSQFYMAPLYLNPAMTGAFDGNYRVAALFRGQWGAVLRDESVPMYRTYTFSADFRTNKAFGKGDAFGIGASFLGDQAGEARFGYNIEQLSLAYHKALNSKATNYLTLGFSAQVFQQTLDFSRLQFGSQWDGSSYNPDFGFKESLIENKLWYVDVNAGLLWYMKIAKRANVYVGASAFHLNTPKVSMLGDKNGPNVPKLNRKFVGHAGIRFPIGGRFDLQPKTIFMAQGKSIENIIGADFRILFDERNPDGSNFRVGGMMRMVGGDPNAPWRGKRISPESVAITAGVDWEGLSLGVAYDITVSQLITGNQSRGGFEVGLTYVGSWNKRRPQTMYCPKFN